MSLVFAAFSFIPDRLSVPSAVVERPAGLIAPQLLPESWFAAKT